jgi:hypothetical protein
LEALLGMTLGGTVAVVLVAALLRVTVFKLLRTNKKSALVLSYLLAGAIGVAIYNFADNTNPNAFVESVVAYIAPAALLATLTAIFRPKDSSDPAEEFSDE